ncbi:type II site-specific deoxyribonuclease (Sau96I-li(EC:3.1.21.4) [uncultured Gammaproteobacteria bacterium]|nr:type II site-specific deoxyribonuclease (Sau96I-li(EC:3.1.21.4) [uncultured Gammaproteobacteria bacterium]CAC9660297.1 type II site-specific deoxyribonuclease (Sau96I-li(EC:3.1.21.4) [uncultured Gammaproteobacteria bacterium]
MGKYNLNFISDKNLFNHVKNTVNGYRFDINLEKFNKNLIDPIKLTFDAGIYGKNIQEVVESEVIRQIDKSNTNLIGYFHQNIFHYIGDGWSVPNEGWDVIHQSKKIYVEMKNKHNTMNSSSSKNTYIRMLDQLVNESEATCMLVEVIAKNSQNISWDTTIDKKKVSNESIRRVSIDKFYELVTSDRLAFKKLCEILPKVIDDVVNQITLDNESNTVVSELKQISPNLLKSLYLLSFEKYEGFGDFNV